MTQIGMHYGQALYQLAQQEQLEELILQQLQLLAECFAQAADFTRLMGSANIPKQERCAILEDSFRGKVHLYVLNFLRILAEKGHFKQFPQCVQSYRDCYDKSHGILEVRVTTAVKLTQDRKNALCQKLSASTQKEIRLVCQVDPAVLGGVRLDYDGLRVEDTLSARLENIQNVLKNTVL